MWWVIKFLPVKTCPFPKYSFDLPHPNPQVPIKINTKNSFWLNSNLIEFNWTVRILSTISVFLSHYYLPKGCVFLSLSLQLLKILCELLCGYYHYNWKHVSLKFKVMVKLPWFTVFNRERKLQNTFFLEKSQFNIWVYVCAMKKTFGWKNTIPLTLVISGEWNWKMGERCLNFI